MQSCAQNSLSNPSRAALLDFDGTLGVTLPAWTDAFDAALRHHGVTLSHDEVIHAWFHACPDEFIRSHPIPDPGKFKELVWRNVMDRMNHVSPYPLMRETLQALSDAGYKIAVVTNSRRTAVEPVLARWQVEHLFDVIVSIDDVSHGKPDPQMIHHALNALNISPSDAFIMGDSKSDVVAGKRAGVKTIAFSPEENRKYLALEALRFTEPSHLIHSYDDLWEVLKIPPTPASAGKTP